MKGGRRRQEEKDDDGGDSTNPFADDSGDASSATNNPFAAAPVASSSSASSAMASYYAQLAAPAPAPAQAPSTPPTAARKPSISAPPTATTPTTSSSSSASLPPSASASPTFRLEAATWKPSKEQGSIVSLSAGNDVLVIGTSSNALIRWNTESDEVDTVQLSKRVDDRIHRVYVDPFGHHCLVSMVNGTNHYLHAHWQKAHTLTKLKGLVIDSVAWNHVEGPSVATSHRILLGTSKGVILEAQLDEKEKDRHVKKLYDLNDADAGGGGSGSGGGGGPISGLAMEAFPPPAGEAVERYLVIAATPTRQYQFIGGPTLEKVFERYQAMPAFLELPGDLGHSELRSFARYATSTQTQSKAANTVAWLTGAGIYYGELRFGAGDEVGEQQVLEDGKLLAYPQDPVSRAIIPPLSLLVTEFHFLLLTPSRLLAINQVSEEIVYEKAFNVKQTGDMVGLAFDAVHSVKWLYTTKGVYEVVIEGEDREMWRLFLQQGKYEEALEYADSEEDRQEVLTAHADYDFANKQYQLAARLYAKTHRPFEQIALQFVQLSYQHSEANGAFASQPDKGAGGSRVNGVNGGGAGALPGHSGSHGDSMASSAALSTPSSTSALDARSALKIYLLEKLETLAPTALIQQMMICTWLTEIFLDNINRLQDPPATPALTEASEQRKAQVAQSRGGGGGSAEEGEDGGGADAVASSSFSPFAVDNGVPSSLTSLSSPTSVGSSPSTPSFPSALFDDDPFTSLSAAERGDLLAAEVDEFHTFLRDRSDCLNKSTTIELLSSHGRMEEWLLYAKDDLEWVLQQHMQEEQWDDALKVLRRHSQPAKIADLFYKFVPTLILHRPAEVSELLADTKALDPAKLIPALMRYEEHYEAAAASGRPLPSSSPLPLHLALSYLEVCVYRLRNRDPVVHNYLISLYASQQDATPFLRYLDSQKQSPVFDTQYALRVCYEHGQMQACVAIYSMMRLYEEAVQLALTFDIPLAKRVVQQAEQSIDPSAAAGGVGSTASGLPSSSVLSSSSAAANGGAAVIDPSTAKRLWLLIAQQVIRSHSASIPTAMALLKDCGRLSLEDLLPFFPDFVRIGELKGEIARSLDAYNVAIEALHGEMAASTAAAQQIRGELQALKQRSGGVAVNRKCDLCALPLLTQPFLLFPCTHCTHVECAKAEVLSYWDKHPHARKRAIHERVQREKSRQRERQQREASTAAHSKQQPHSTPSASLAPAVDDWASLSKAAKEARVLSECVASECVLCGSVMIDSVQLPFIAEQDPAEMREIETWKI